MAPLLLFYAVFPCRRAQQSLSFRRECGWTARHGLRIQIVDEQNRPMLALSKVEPQPDTKTILRENGTMLNDVNDKISLSGHTDSKPHQSG